MENELEQLLALAEAETAPGDDLNEAERFVVSVGIKEGPAKIVAMLIWFRYKDWAKKPITWAAFFRDFRKIFKITVGNGNEQRYYLLDPAPFDLSPDHLWHVRRCIRDERERQRREKEKKQAKRKSLSGPGKGTERKD